jgi:GINS complex subunit 2
MALPRQLQPSLTPDELVFLAEEDVVDIVPLFSMTKVRLLSVSRRQRSEEGRSEEWR